MSLTLSLPAARRGPRNPNPDTTPGDGLPAAGETRPPPDLSEEERQKQLDKQELFNKFRTWFKDSRDHYKDWRNEAVSCFDFVAGTQWSDEDMQTLRDQGRPAVTFNRVQPFVDGVSGLEVGNRQETQYLPRTLGKSGVNELLTGAAEWVRQSCDAEDEESEAFRDCIVCGIGATQTRMEYVNEPDGMIVIERVDPLEFYPDPASRKPNFADARYVLRVKDVPIAVAEDLFPGYSAIDLHARWAEDEPDIQQDPHNARIAPYYRVDQAGEIDRHRQQCRLVEVEWWDYVDAFRVVDPGSGRIVSLSGEEAGRYRVRTKLLGMTPSMVKTKKKKYYKAIVGAEILDIMRGPDEGGFSYKFMTGKRDRNKAQWYGLVRAMRDPQMWANKFFTQMLHIVNTNAKGGLLIETDAAVDPQELRDSWADADSIIELNPGGLEKIKEKNPPAFPTQLNAMMATALDAIPATAGINLEMIAQQNQDQAAILEMQRKQQGMTVLAYIFNSKRRYQKEQGRLMLWMITTFIADGRLIRIGGPEDAQYVPLVHEPGLSTYDVIVDEAPTSPNMKERVWGLIMQMFPVLRTIPLPPQAITELMKYAPFPASLIQSLQNIMAQSAQQAQQQNPQMAAAMQLAQAQAAESQARAQQAASVAQLNQAKIQHTQAQTAHTGAQAQKLNVEAQLMPGQAQSDAAEREARVSLLRSQAVNQLQNAGMQPEIAAHDILQKHQQAQHEQNMDLVDHQHEARMDIAQHQHDRQLDWAQHAHQQQLDMAKHGHEQSVAWAQHQHQQRMDQLAHALDKWKAQNPPKPAAKA